MDIDYAILDNQTKVPSGISLLSDLYKQKELLSGASFDGKDREFLKRFPQFKRFWRWEHQLRLGYIFASELPDYDVRANEEMKSILQQIKGTVYADC